MKIFTKKFSDLRRSRFLRYGVPFFGMVIGGSFFFEQFNRVKLKYGKQSSLLIPQDLQKEGLQVAKAGSITLESEYEKLKELDIDSWEQVRAPRPWNEDEEED